MMKPSSKKQSLFFSQVFAMAIALLALLVPSSVDAQKTAKATKADVQHEVEREFVHSLDNLDNWYNTKAETKISLFETSPPKKMKTVLFANVVDHEKGDDPNYLIGWPRMGIHLSKLKKEDVSQFDYIEFWIYTETSRETLPKNAITAGLYHGDKARGKSTFLIDTCIINGWVRVEIPVSKIKFPKDVQKLQFNINEADYKQGDKINFYLSAPAYVRYKNTIFDKVNLDQAVLYTDQKQLEGSFTFLGPVIDTPLTLEMELVNTREKSVHSKRYKVKSDGEVVLPFSQKIRAGHYTIRFQLKDSGRNVIDKKEIPVRVIKSPF